MTNNNILEENFFKLSNDEISKVYTSLKGENSTMVFAYDGTRRSYLISQGLKNLKVCNSPLATSANTSNSANFNNFNNNSNNNNNNNNSNNNNNNNNKNTEIKIDYNEYSKTAIHNFLYLSIMMFQHGIKNIVYPMWFCTLEKRGPEYLPKFIQYLWGLSKLLDPNYDFFKLFQENGVRIIFYGEYKKLLERGNDNELLSKFEEIMDKTKNNSNKILLLGTNIEEPSQTIINNTLSFYKKFGREPTKNDLIQHYYGVNTQIDDVSFYLGFDRFSTDGRPILISDKGAEDLYYTVSPHSFLSTNGFRKVLYDHIYQRTITNAKEYELKVNDIEMMKKFYENNSNNIMGIGNVNPNGNYWHPSPQVELPQKSIEQLNYDNSQTIISTSPTNEAFKLFKQLDINSNLNNYNTNNNNSNNLIGCKQHNSFINEENQQYQYCQTLTIKQNISMGSPSSPRYLDKFI
ncbi:hypothetical protein ACTFIR_010248 [Dictyostelium discoideum]